MFFGCTKEQNVKDDRKTVYRLSEIEKSQLETGDLILRKGYGFVSNMIYKLMDEDYEVTHIGVIIKNKDSIRVAHSLSSKVSEQDGLRFQELDSFVFHSIDSTLLVTRVKNIRKQQQEDIATQLSYYLTQHIPFDHAFDYHDTTAFYCSELVWKIYEDNLHILNVDDTISDNYKYQSLKIFYDTQYVDIILNHHL